MSSPRSAARDKAATPTRLRLHLQEEPQPAPPAAPTSLSATAGEPAGQPILDREQRCYQLQCHARYCQRWALHAARRRHNHQLRRHRPDQRHDLLLRGGPQLARRDKVATPTRLPLHLPEEPQPALPAAPTSLSATAGNQQVSLSWTASSGATSYNVMRGSANGGPYTQLAAATTTSYVDTGLTNGTTYYYVVVAVGPAGPSGNSNQASATPMGAAGSINVNVNVLANRHAISPYIYGGSYPQDAAHVTDSGLSVVRWGGDSTLNLQLATADRQLRQRLLLRRLRGRRLQQR